VTIEPYSNIFPLEWGLELLTDEQINQVKDCDIENLASERYPDYVDELIYRFEPNTSCDWAVLAFAYADRVDEDKDLPDIAINAFAQAISENFGFVFSMPFFYRFFDAFPIVKSPPFSNQEIARVKIEYSWVGMGEPVEYTVDIRQANTNPIIKVTDYEPATIIQDLKYTIDKEIVQSLGNSLSNLLPINNQFSLIPCDDNNPDWTVTITLKDGSLLTLKTNESNMIYMGGPWQTNIAGQDYVQYSGIFAEALDNLIQEIGLSYGQPMAMYCGLVNVFGQAYP